MEKCQSVEYSLPSSHPHSNAARSIKYIYIFSYVDYANYRKNMCWNVKPNSRAIATGIFNSQNFPSSSKRNREVYLYKRELEMILYWEWKPGSGYWSPVFEVSCAVKEEVVCKRDHEMDSNFTTKGRQRKEWVKCFSSTLSLSPIHTTTLKNDENNNLPALLRRHLQKFSFSHVFYILKSVIVF